MSLLCTEIVGAVTAGWSSGSETHVFPAGIPMPIAPAPPYLRLNVTAVTGAADIYTFYQPIGGALASLGAPHPLANVNAPAALDWVLPDNGGGTCYVNILGYSGGATSITTDAQECYYETTTEFVIKAAVESCCADLSAQLADILAAVRKTY